MAMTHLCQWTLDPERRLSEYCVSGIVLRLFFICFTRSSLDRKITDTTYLGPFALRGPPFKAMRGECGWASDRTREKTADQQLLAFRLEVLKIVIRNDGTT